VVKRNPALIVTLVSSSGGTLASGERLGLDSDDLGLLAGLGTLGLGEEGLDVGLVDEVGGSGEGSTQDQVQEDANALSAVTREYKRYVF
jgi:hypothetical protein